MALTEQHRLAQLAIRARALRSFQRIWPAFDLTERTWGTVEEAALNLIELRRLQSAQLGAAYYPAFRQAEGLSGVVTVPPAELTADALEAARVSLQVTGFVTARRLAAENAPNPLETAFVRAAGALGRHVVDGGRVTVLDAISSDRSALGWARVTSGRACAFCAILASRGPVYTEATVRFRAHDHCVCGAEPVFFRNADWPPHSRDYEQLYKESAVGAADPALAFRRAYEGRAA
jgi:hypothetical protein